MKIITFFSNKNRVGKTSTIYHTASMFSELGHKVLAVDLDPQSNLSALFLTEYRMQQVALEEENKLI